MNMIAEKKFINTSQFAELLGVKPDTIRHALCVRGDYMGIRPLKLPNARLMWSAREAERILGDDVADEQ
jgi:hypothetical protein